MSDNGLKLSMLSNDMSEVDIFQEAYIFSHFQKLKIKQGNFSVRQYQIKHFGMEFKKSKSKLSLNYSFGSDESNNNTNQIQGYFENENIENIQF